MATAGASYGGGGGGECIRPVLPLEAFESLVAAVTWIDIHDKQARRPAGDAYVRVGQVRPPLADFLFLVGSVIDATWN